MDDSELGRIGSGICDAVAELLDVIAATSSHLFPDNFKCLSEAIIATALAGSAEALALNVRLGELLFSPRLRAQFCRNPGHVTLYALPSLFLHRPPPGHGIVRTLFQRLHQNQAAQSPSYPAYRNSELDYVHARLVGRPFYLDPFAQFGLTFPWLTRDHVYALTHLHLYNSDFARQSVGYAAPATEILEALIARAHAEGDVDLLLELILCYATTEGASPARIAHHDGLCARLLARMIGPDGRILAGRCFTRIYHPLLLAWIYRTVRGEAFHGAAGEEEQDRGQESASLFSLGKVMAAFGRGDPLEIFGRYGDHIDLFGPSAAVEKALSLHGALLRETLNARSMPLPAREALCPPALGANPP